jgi:hypothetical protein
MIISCRLSGSISKLGPLMLIAKPLNFKSGTQRVKIDLRQLQVAIIKALMELSLLMT